MRGGFDNVVFNSYLQRVFVFTNSCKILGDFGEKLCPTTLICRAFFVVLPDSAVSLSKSSASNTRENDFCGEKRKDVTYKTLR